MGRKSTYLFAEPSFLGGFASALDIGATLVEYNKSLSPEEADYRAISMDWKAIGDDFRVALTQTAKKFRGPGQEE